MTDRTNVSGERTLEQVKAEILRRAGRNSPLEHITPEDAQAAVAALTSLDRDHWAEVWCTIGLRHEARGDALQQQGAAAGWGGGAPLDRYDRGWIRRQVSRRTWPAFSAGSLAERAGTGISACVQLARLSIGCHAVSDRRWWWVGRIGIKRGVAVVGAGCCGMVGK